MGNYTYEINSFTVTGGKLISDCHEVDIFNDDFESTDGGWIERAYPVSFGLESGKLKVVASTLGQGAKKTETTVIGEDYTFAFTLSGMDINDRVQILIYDAVASTYYNDPSVLFGNGTYELTFTAASTSTRVEFYPQDFNTGTFSPNCTFLLDDTRLYSFDETDPCSSSVLDDQVIVDDKFEDEVVCSVDGGDYRYSFQGQEHDDEVKGVGNSINYTFRMHDPRLGRFFAVDPLAPKYPHNSPYAFSENKLIAWCELEGLESYYSADGKYLGQVGNNASIRVLNNNIVEKDVILQITLINSESGYMTDHINYLTSNSIEAFTRDKLYGVLKEWGDKYVPLSEDKEYAMGIFELEIETNSGEFKKVYMTGNTVESGLRSESDPQKCELTIGKKRMAGVESTPDYGGSFVYKTHGKN